LLEKSPDEAQEQGNWEALDTNIDSNVTPNGQNPDELLAYLSAPIRAVHEALDRGVSEAELVLEGRKWDPHMYADLIRYEARCWLEDQVTTAWQIDRTLANSGIQITRGPVVMRARMSQHGALPGPGRSYALQDFYRQHPLPLVIDGAVLTSNANLVLAYTVNNDQTIGLCLCKPKSEALLGREAEFEWRKRVTINSGEGLTFTPSADQEIELGEAIEGRDTEII